MTETKVVVTGKISPLRGYVIPYSAKTKPHLQHYLLANGATNPNAYVTYVVPSASDFL